MQFVGDPLVVRNCFDTVGRTRNRDRACFIRLASATDASDKTGMKTRIPAQDYANTGIDKPRKDDTSMWIIRNDTKRP